MAHRVVAPFLFVCDKGGYVVHLAVEQSSSRLRVSACLSVPVGKARPDYTPWMLIQSKPCSTCIYHPEFWEIWGEYQVLALGT